MPSTNVARKAKEAPIVAYLNVYYGNHLDLTWRRPRYVAGHTDQWTIAPYADIQERQLDHAMEFMRQGGVYELEQTISLREYLERNPDFEEEVARMIADGRLRVLGGGESVIDYDLPDGESIVRNHLYSRRWLQEKYGVAPKLAATPDTFGLSAGLPGLFRQLGYRGLLSFARVFLNHKPYWRGLSGDVIALGSAYGDPRNEVGYCSFIKTKVCGVCGGTGCPVCQDAGCLLVETPETPDGILSFADRIREAAEKGDVGISINGEESAAPFGLVEKLRQLADECGLELRFTSTEEYAVSAHKDLLDNVDNAREEDIDPRCEGNPTGSGCYTSRIRLKQENRLCESALRSAERLATAASLQGEKYPAKTIEYWWRKLAFIQFHDALPASHSDDAYAELMETCRALRSAMARIIEKSARKLLEKVDVPGEGSAFAVFNPLEFPVKSAVLSGVGECPRYVKSGYVIAPDGTKAPVLSFKRTITPQSDAVLITFLGDVPAFGYSVFRFEPHEEPFTPETAMPHGCVMENDFLRLEFSHRCVEKIIDKANDKVIGGRFSFSPRISDDAGHPWGRSAPSMHNEYADDDGYNENMMPPEAFSQKVTYERRDGVQIVRIYVEYGRKDQKVNHLAWMSEFTLADNSRQLNVRIVTSFDAQDQRLSTRLTLPEKYHITQMTREVPLGEVTCGPVDDFNSQIGAGDEWPTLRYATVDVEGVQVALCNFGTAGYRMDVPYFGGDSALEVSLLRTPTQVGCGYGFDGAIDPTEHEFRFTLLVTKNDMDAYRQGMILNTAFPVQRVRPCKGVKPLQASLMHLPDNAPLLALKGAEDGNGYICRYVGKAAEDELVFAAPVTPVSVLEYGEETPTQRFPLPKYTMRTFRLDENALRK